MTISTITPSSEWIENWNKYKKLFHPTIDFKTIFNQAQLDNFKLHLLELGKVKFPSGKIIVCDPLVDLPDTNNHLYTYQQTIPTGIHKLQVLVTEFPEGYTKYAFCRLKCSEQEAVTWEIAVKGNENFTLSKNNDDVLFGFGVDAGFTSILDIETARSYSDFAQKWLKKQENNPDFADIYSDFFEELLEQNAEIYPQFNEEEWLLFSIPNTDLVLPMISSGWGDGYYPVFFGYDTQGQVCEVVIDFSVLDNEDENKVEDKKEEGPPDLTEIFVWLKKLWQSIKN